MRYLLLVLGFVIVFLTSSCRRTFTCICTTVDNTGSTPDLVIEEEINNSRRNAKDLCESGTTDFGNGGFSTTCVLQ